MSYIALLIMMSPNKFSLIPIRLSALYNKAILLEMGKIASYFLMGHILLPW